MTLTPSSQLPASIPRHVAIIVDGNRRWAKNHGKPIIQGHRQGYKVLKQITEAAFDRGVKEVSAYVFSTENWSRDKTEVNNLMRLARRIFKQDANQMHAKNVRIRVSGLKHNVPADILKLIVTTTKKTQNNTKGILNLCFNYGGRADILQAVKNLIKAGKKAEEVNESVFSKALSTAGLHDVDLLIRTSESRLSNFLPWESTYAELYFLPDKLFPDFTVADLDKALEFYATRHRRFGT